MEESNYLPPPVILMATGLQPADRIIRIEYFSLSK
jgi:hypothetical protein